jgi:two-component system NtrC family response regulator
VVARAIFEARPVPRGAFVAVNCSAIPDELFESEMFGHKKGAFTGANTDRIGRFEKADKGTIFLDEIGELEAGSQVKLLRVLQEKSFEKLGSSQSQKTDIRIISATNRNLSEMISEGKFREDLYYRINLIQLHLPSLSERREDIPLLVSHFKEKVVDNYGLQPVNIEEEALSWLQNQDFPGNIRQLSNLVERVVLMNLGVDTLDIHYFKNLVHAGQVVPEKIDLPKVGQITLDELEKTMIIKTLDHHQHSISQSARSLGITRSALYRRLEKYQIPHESHL